MAILIIVVFVVGYFMIAMEHPFKIDKAGSALVTGVLCWIILMAGLSDMGLPAEATKIYLEKTVENFNHYGRDAMTGPLVRKDLITIQSNLKALSGDPFQPVYSAFVEAYK